MQKVAIAFACLACTCSSMRRGRVGPKTRAASPLSISENRCFPRKPLASLLLASGTSGFNLFPAGVLPTKRLPRRAFLEGMQRNEIAMQDDDVATAEAAAAAVEQMAAVGVTPGALMQARQFSLTLAKPFGAVLTEVEPAGVIIEDLREGGNAQKSGLLFRNDKLLKVDGKDVSASSFQEVIDLLAGAGDLVELVVERLVKESAPEPVAQATLAEELVAAIDDTIEGVLEPIAKEITEGLVEEQLVKGDTPEPVAKGAPAEETAAVDDKKEDVVELAAKLTTEGPVEEQPVIEDAPEPVATEALAEETAAIDDKEDVVEPIARDTTVSFAEEQEDALAKGADDSLKSMENPGEGAVTKGAAAVGAVLGVQVAGGLTSAAFLSVLLAYLTTLDNSLGNAAQATGRLAAKAYGKTVDLNDEYEILQKTKGATDTVATTARNFNRYYGWTDRIAKENVEELEEVSRKIEAIRKQVGKVREFALAVSAKNEEIQGLVNERMDKPVDKSSTIGAAFVGGLIGLQVLGGLSNAVLLSCLLAYAATLGSALGDAVKKAGDLAAKTYGKAVEINDEYEILQKTKSATDTVTTVARNFNQYYGWTDSIDEELEISAKIEKLAGSVDEAKSSVKVNVGRFVGAFE